MLLPQHFFHFVPELIRFVALTAAALPAVSQFGQLLLQAVEKNVCILSLHEHETPEEILKSGAHFSLGPFILPRSCQAILQLYSPYSLNKATTFISVPPARCPHHLFLSHSTKSQTQPQVFMCSALPGTQNKAQGSHGAAGTLWQFQVEIPQKALDAELYQFRL